MKKRKEKKSFQNEKIKIGWMTIPNQIVFNTELRQLSKFVLGLILSFQYESQCYAGDQWFADQFGCSKRTMESIMQELRDGGYIETTYDPKTKERLILPANKTLWDAYSAIRQGNRGLAETQGPRKATTADPEETEKKDLEDPDPLSEEIIKVKKERQDRIKDLKKLWEM